MKRLFDWPERVIALIEERRHMPFIWGTNDCALFPADCVLAATGVDLAAGMRTYTTELGAARIVRKRGGMEGLARGLREKHIGFAQFSDIVLTKIEGRKTYGLVMRDTSWCAPGVSGLVFRPLTDAIKLFEF